MTGLSAITLWFNLYTEHIMRNAGLDEFQAGIKIIGTDMNNLRYADDTTLMAENKEKQKCLFRRVKEKERAGLKLNIKKKQDHGIWPHYLMGKIKGKDRFPLLRL